MAAVEEAESPFPGLASHEERGTEAIASPVLPEAMAGDSKPAKAPSAPSQNQPQRIRDWGLGIRDWDAGVQSTKYRAGNRSGLFMCLFLPKSAFHLDGLPLALHFGRQFQFRGQKMATGQFVTQCVTSTEYKVRSGETALLHK